MKRTMLSLITGLGILFLSVTANAQGWIQDSVGWIPWLKDGSYVAYKGMDKYVYTIAGACSDSISVNGIPLRRTKSDSAFYTTSGNGYTYTVVPFSDQMFIFGITKLSNFGMTFYEFHLQQ